MTFLKIMMPVSTNRYARTLAWLSLVVQVGIVVTGGAVRLTASGLGCPEWPTCDGTSIVTTPEMGIHGLIEFGNRLLTFVLVLVALLTFLAFLRQRKTRPVLFWLSLALGFGIPAQAIIGGVSVWLKLNPYVVGLHFVISAILVAVATLLLDFVRHENNAPKQSAPLLLLVLVWLLAAAESIVVLLGILTTGAGPHAGDAQAPRNGINPLVIETLHSIAAYTALGALAIVVIFALASRLTSLARAGFILWAVNVAQLTVGIWQARSGLPPLLVGLHMLLACLVVAGVAHLLYVASTRYSTLKTNS